ncbi:MAG: MFS transporter [Pseudomonadota bacterium]
MNLSGSERAQLAQTATPTDWPRLALLFLCGVFGSTQIGKLPPSMAELHAQFNATMVQLGWIASIFNLLAATSGLAIGLMADRIGQRRILKAGLAVLALGAMLGALSNSLPLLFMSRVIEGLGFLCVVVGAPVLLREASGIGHRHLVLGIWGSYMGIGMTSMMLLSPYLIAWAGWRSVWWFSAAGAVLLLAITILTFPGNARNAAPGQSGAGVLKGLRVAAPWLVACCFALYSSEWISMMIWLPTFLRQELGMTLVAATPIVAVIILANSPGNWLGGYMAQRGVHYSHAVVAATSVMGVLGWCVLSFDFAPIVKFGMCVMFSFAGGIIPGTIFSSVPALASRHGNLGAINGLVAQGANVGILFGPPLAAAVVTMSGSWRGLGPAYLLASALCATLILVAGGWTSQRGAARG